MRSADGVPTAGDPRDPVLVVGAGPAGSSLALRLSRAGIPVRLLDAASFPRSKPCGDCLSPGATPLLRELGLVEAIRRRRPARLRGWRIRTPGGRWFGDDFSARWGAAPPFGYALPREELDAAMLQAAVEAGAEFRPRHRVFRLLRRDGRVVGAVARDGRGRERSFRSSLLVGADGLRSAVARRVAGVDRGPRRRLAVVARYEEAPQVELRGELRLTPRGVVGVAPIGARRVNVTAVVPADRAGEISADRSAFFRGELRRTGLLARLAGARRIGSLEVTGPFQVTPRTVAAPGVLLVGDAAGYFDPLTGQGIHRALATARLAARFVPALVRSASDGADARHGEADLHRRYRRELRRVLAPGRRVQRAVDAVVDRPVLIEAVGSLLSLRSGLAGLLLEVTGDRLPASSLLRPDRILAAGVRFA